ncbi:MAG: hypothetical protein HYR56_11010 [Acidobacteria bacterium]|nr:hypothetical protein [Acidobacteriota bacterium]MBI3428312.1 hypothetical protein [Acidobacteriota bacterium]
MFHPDDYDAVVLGAGPAGLLAALALARTQRTALLADRLPAATDPPRVEATPAALLTLLLEFGLHPAELGVTRLYEARVSAWETAVPTTQPSPATAHLARPALELALLRRAAAAPRLDLIQCRVSAPLVRQLSQAAKRGVRLLDATGRHAVTASTRTQPSQPWGSRSFWVSTRECQVDGAFMLAALPAGYVYRLGTTGYAGIGLVGRGKLLSANAQEIQPQLRHCGAAWILDGLPPLEQMSQGKAAPASVQWTAGGPAWRLGDAALARDALSSQGLSCGISEALYAAAKQMPQNDGLFASRQAEQRALHLQGLEQVISNCHYRHHAAWSSYADFIRSHAATITRHPSIALKDNRLIHTN